MSQALRGRIKRLAQASRPGSLAEALRAALETCERIATLPEADLRILAEDPSKSPWERQLALQRLAQESHGTEQAHWREQLQELESGERESMRQALAGPLPALRRGLYESILGDQVRAEVPRRGSGAG